MSYESYSNPVVTQTPTNTAPQSLALELTPSVTKNLQSSSNDDKITGVKQLLAIMSKGEDVSSFFPLVVQEITSENEALRHLSYIYLVHYAESDPDSALMSINTFQRSLSDSDPIVRALALKILSSIRNREIIEIVIDAVTKCALDGSPYVRKAAALAIVKINETCDEYTDELLPIIKRLLNDQSVIAISGALYALQCIAPDYDDLIHPVFRTLCTALSKLDPWAQTTALHILQRYARRNFKKPSGTSDWFAEDYEDEDSQIDPDLDLLLKNTQPLLSSITPSVVVAAASLMFYCAPPLKIALIAKPLIRLIYTNSATAYPALLAIASLAADNAEPFIPHVRHFFLSYDEPVYIKRLKLQILSQLARPSNSDILMREISQHIHGSNKEIAAEAVKAMGRTAALAGDSSMQCIDIIVKMLSSPSLSIINQATKVLALLLRPLPKKSEEIEEMEETDELFGSSQPMDKNDVIAILKKMLRAFPKIEEPETKAALMSIVGDKAELIPEYAHEVLRRIAADFSNQAACVKLQALQLAAKVMCIRPSESLELVRYVFSLSSLDPDITVRDRARVIHALLTAKSDEQYIIELRKNPKSFIFPEKPPVVWGVDVMRASEVEIGSFSQVVGRVISKSSHVVEWADPSQLPSANLRDEVFDEEYAAPDESAPLQERHDGEEEDLDGYFGAVEEKEGKEEEESYEEEHKEALKNTEEEQKTEEINLDDFLRGDSKDDVGGDLDNYFD
jgi:AP-3 complex subunit beta